MDKVTVSDPGPIVELAGKQLREVATIDLTKVGLAPPPRVHPVKITRGTKYTFIHDRPLFELVDPDGRVYVMQAYSQIVDPDLSYDQLRGLRSRVGLPDGWKYRTRKPARTSCSAPTARRRSSRTSSRTPTSGSRPATASSRGPIGVIGQRPRNPTRGPP